MQAFDANDDSRLPGAGQGGSPEPAEDSAEHGPDGWLGEPAPIVRRLRQRRAGHGLGRPGASTSGPGFSPLARRRRAARAGCPLLGRALTVEAPSRRSRRLWAMCHGQPPGSRS